MENFTAERKSYKGSRHWIRPSLSSCQAPDEAVCEEEVTKSKGEI